jgi:hypothetical protein
MKTFLQNHLDDVLITAGAVVIIYATYLLNTIAALYVLGVFLIAVGVLAGIGGGRKQ